MVGNPDAYVDHSHDERIKENMMADQTYVYLATSTVFRDDPDLVTLHHLRVSFSKKERGNLSHLILSYKTGCLEEPGSHSCAKGL